MLKLVSIMSVDTIFLTSSNTNEKMTMQRQKFTMNEGDHLNTVERVQEFHCQQEDQGESDPHGQQRSSLCSSHRHGFTRTR